MEAESINALTQVAMVTCRRRLAGRGPSRCDGGWVGSGSGVGGAKRILMLDRDQVRLTAAGSVSHIWPEPAEVLDSDVIFTIWTLWIQPVVKRGAPHPPISTPPSPSHRPGLDPP